MILNLMNKFIDLINENRLVKFSATVLAFAPILSWVKNLGINEINLSMNNLDVFGLITAVITTGLLLFLLKLVHSLHERMKIFNVITHVRNKRLFVKSFESIEFFRLPNETEQELWNRLPEGRLFRDFYIEEYKIVRDVLQKQMKNKTIHEIEKMLSEYYPINNKNKSK